MSEELYWRNRLYTEGPRYVGKPGQDVFSTVAERWAFGTVLDFGCGVGRWTGIMQKSPRAIPEGVWGWDTNREAVPTGPRFKSPASGPSDAYCNPLQVFNTVFAPGQFDTVFAITVLQHIPELELWQWVVQIQRVLAPGARLVLVEDNNPERAANGPHMNFRDWRYYRELFGKEVVDLSVVSAEREASHYVAVYR